VSTARLAREAPAARDVRIPPSADAVFEGGGVKGIAFAGAVAAAEEAGLREWKNIAGTSAGAIVACLLAVGYDAKRLKEILDDVAYSRFADYGRLGKVQGWVWNQFRTRGLARGLFFTKWLSERIEDSPLGKSLGRGDLTFGDVTRDDLPPDLAPADAQRARYRLQVIGSEITRGRMLVLPHDIEGYYTKDGTPYTPDTLTLVEAVRMSMSYPYLYAPHVLYDSEKRPHYVVDGGLLSNFPVWLFDRRDAKPPARPTWAFRLHGGSLEEPGEPYRPLPMPFWRLKLAKAMFSAATGAWDERQVVQTASVRTVSIPTFDVATTDFNLTRANGDRLYESGYRSTKQFLARDQTRAYLKQFER
jgi:NTE family protein